MGDTSPILPASEPAPPLEYNTGEIARAIEYWLGKIFKGDPPHEGTGYGTVGIEVHNFRIVDIHGTVKRRFLKSEGEQV